MPRTRKPSNRGGPVTFSPVVVIDNREQNPYAFATLRADACDGGGPLVITTRRGTLRSGDYSLRGYERRVVVERKSLADLFSTLGQGRARFERELLRLASFRFAAIVVESEWSEILASPPPRSKLNPKTIYRSVLAWQQRFPHVHWWMVAGRAMGEVTTFRILERFFKEHNHEPLAASGERIHVCGLRNCNQRLLMRSRRRAVLLPGGQPS